MDTRPTHHTDSRAKTEGGFTLIELLVALALLALMSVAAWRGLDAVMQTREHLAQETRKWQHLAYFFSRMEQDVAQAVPRPVRDQTGAEQPAWIGRQLVVSDNDAAVAFTRAGMPEQGAAMMAPQRIGYRLQQGTIVLLRWPELNSAPNAVPLRYPLIEGVSEFTLHYLDAGGAWHDQWPLDSQMTSLPSALGVDITLDSGEKITRLFALQ
jgi:general secretion pathway protein J